MITTPLAGTVPSRKWSRLPDMFTDGVAQEIGGQFFRFFGVPFRIDDAERQDPTSLTLRTTRRGRQGLILVYLTGEAF